MHDFMGINMMTDWNVAQERLPELKPLLEGFKPT
jgi:uncharacterized protein with HEPN domain